MSRAAYDDPVEQVMFILGLKHDPCFPTAFHAIAGGSNPGITNALDQLTAYGAIEANLHAWAKTVKKVREDIGQTIPSGIKDEIYAIIVTELNEKHLGGKWFQEAQIPSKNWVNMAHYSSVFTNDGEVFCLPAPYVEVLKPVI
jgi:hypothetical protein